MAGILHTIFYDFLYLAIRISLKFAAKGVGSKVVSTV